MRISDWSSDVCSSDLDEILERDVGGRIPVHRITDANQRVAVSSGVSRLIDVPKHKMVSLDIDQLFRAADEADSFERGALALAVPQRDPVRGGNVDIGDARVGQEGPDRRVVDIVDVGMLAYKCPTRLENATCATLTPPFPLPT